jgi:hypothetical protein
LPRSIDKLCTFNFLIRRMRDAALNVSPSGTRSGIVTIGVRPSAQAAQPVANNSRDVVSGHLCGRVLAIWQRTCEIASI